MDLNQKLSIAVLGPGAIGGLLAALFCKNKFETVCVDKTDNVVHLNNNGFLVNSQFFGDFVAKIKVVASLDFEPDILFITVKAPFLKVAVDSASKEFVKNSLIIPLLNGIDHLDFLKARYGKNVVAGTIGCIESFSPELGRIEHLSKNAPCVTLCSGNEKTKEKIKKAIGILKEIGVDVSTLEDEKAVLWSKFARLVAVATLTAATGESLGYVRSDSKWRDVLRNFAAEVSAAAKFDGVKITTQDIISQIEKLPADLRSSLQKDLAAKFPSELDALTGAILRRCEKYKIFCPVAANLIDEIEKKYF